MRQIESALDAVFTFDGQSPYEKVSVIALTASIERPGDWNSMAIVWFHPTPECKARFEFFGPRQTSKGYFLSFRLGATPHSGF